MKKATIAPTIVLQKYGATAVIENDGTGCGLLINGWKFSSNHDKICNSKDLLKLARNIESIVTNKSSDVMVLNNSYSDSDEVSAEHSRRNEHSDHVNISGYSLHLPPMLFLNDYMNIEHVSSNIAIHLCSSDSLTAWAAKHSDSATSRHPLEVAQVPYAHTWTKQSLPQVSETKDTPPDEQIGHSSSSLGNCINNSDKGKWDWTFSSDYCCTLRRRSKGKTENSIITAMLLADELCHSTGEFITSLGYDSEPTADNSESDSPEWQWRWQRATQSGLDMALLRRTDADAPILFYDEFTLYQVIRVNIASACHTV